MKNFNRGGGFGDRKSGGFGDRKSSGSFGRRDSGSRSFGRGDGGSSRPDMHKATCADCGQSCEVPFKPSGDRPIYCSNCFKGKEASSAPRSGGRDFSRPSFSDRGDRKLFKATCADCGKSCEVPFQPSSGKPVYCSECFGGKEDGGSRNTVSNNSGNSRANENFEALNAKLDKILRALELIMPTKSVSKTEIVKEAVKTVPAKVEAAKETKTSEPKKIVKKVAKKAMVVKDSKTKKTNKK